MLLTIITLVLGVCSSAYADICTMPVDTGPCEAQLESWYYNQETGLCELFTYGGCQGNDNRFESEIECRDMCDAQEPIDICTMPVDTGPCEAQLESWYYNQETGFCERFDYGGCQGNDNRFESEIECRDMCDTQEPIGTTCRGVDLSGCGPIGRPDPRCDETTCAWGSVSHTYSCPAALTCDMDCYGCHEDTLLCADMRAQYVSCDVDPVHISTCSKKMGVGIIMYQYTCVNQVNVEETVTCHELCCCEKHPAGTPGAPGTQGPSGTPGADRPYCTRSDVINWGFEEEEAVDKDAYCPGYDLPEGN